MEKKRTDSTLYIRADYLGKITELSNLYGMNKVTFVQAMVDYFDFYKISPMERKENLDSKLNKIENNLEKKLSDVRDTFVKFFRTMEKDKLEPVIKQTNESTMALLLFLKEQALTKDDLKNIGLSGRRVDAFEKTEPGAQQAVVNSNMNAESPSSDALTQYKQKANSSLDLYKTYFKELIKSVSRTNDEGDFILVSAINNFRDKIQSIPKIKYTGPKDPEIYEEIEQIQTALRTVDNYCDQFLIKGQMAAGKDKLFYTHTIREFEAKFEYINIK